MNHVFNRLSFVVVTVTVALALPVAAADRPHAPVSFGTFNSLPEWVPAHVGVQDGVLSQEHLGVYLPRLRRAAQLNAPATAGAPAQCQVFKGWTSEHFEPRGTLTELTKSSRQVVTGRIVGMEEGFMRGIPGTLLRLSGALLKGNAHSPEWYLFYPLAKIETSEGPICSRPVGDFVPPQIGDRVLVFGIIGASASGSATIFWADPTHELVHDSITAGRRRVPNALIKTHQQATFDEIERSVRGYIDTTMARR